MKTIVEQFETEIPHGPKCYKPKEYLKTGGPWHEDYCPYLKDSWWCSLMEEWRMKLDKQCGINEVAGKGE